MRFGGISTQVRNRLPYRPGIRRVESRLRCALAAGLNYLRDGGPRQRFLRGQPFLSLAQAANRLYPVDEDTAYWPGLRHHAKAAAAIVRKRLDALPPRTGAPRLLVLLGSLTRYGGNISVVELVQDLHAAGWEITVAVSSPHQPDLHDDLPVPPRFYLGHEHFLAQAPQADVVLATWWTTAYAALDLCQTRPGLLPAYFVQDFEPWFYPEEFRYLRDCVAETYRLMPFCFAKTLWLCARIRDAGGTASQVPPALDLQRFHPVNEPPGDTVLAMVRPESPQRGFNTVKWLFEALHRARPGTHLIAFGSDEESAAHIDAPVDHRGRVPNNDMPALYRSARVFVECSDFHGFGRTVAESLACGTPCVATSSGGVDAFLRDGENGVLVPSGDKESLLRAVLRILDDDALHARLRSGAIPSVAHFDRSHASMCTARLLTDLHQGGTCSATYQ